MKPKFLPPACILSLLFFVQCGPDPEPKTEPTQREIVIEKMTSGTGTWAPGGNSGITVEGVDVTETLFPGFTIKFESSDRFTTTGTTPVWLRSDTWNLNDAGTAFVRGQDNKTVTISNLSDTQIKLTLEWDDTTYGDGRKRSLKGTHEFILGK